MLQTPPSSPARLPEAFNSVLYNVISSNWPIRMSFQTDNCFTLDGNSGMMEKQVLIVGLL